MPGGLRHLPGPPRRHPPATTSCHSSGSRCRMSNASAINARADPSVVSIRAPNSAAANSNTSGVPSPPAAVPALHQARFQTAFGCRDDANPTNAPLAPPRRILVPGPGGERPTPATMSSPLQPTHLLIEHTFILDAGSDTFRSHKAARESGSLRSARGDCPHQRPHGRAELRVLSAEPRGWRSAAISSTIPDRRPPGNRCPREDPHDSIGTPDSRSLARSRSTVRRPTPRWRRERHSTPAAGSHEEFDELLLPSTRRRVRWLSRDSAARCTTGAVFGAIR